MWKSKPCEYPRESVSAAEEGKCQSPHEEALTVKKNQYRRQKNLYG